MTDKELDDYMKTVNPNFDSHIGKGTIEMSNEYYNLLEEKKEFINYLQKEINSYTSHIEAIDSVCSSIYSSDYDNSKVKLAIYKEILQKYKEIVNGSKRI